MSDTLAEQPPAALVRHLNDIGISGCRCPWQQRPRSGWVRLRSQPNCPHHDPGYQQRHLDETLRRLIPADYPASPSLDAGIVRQLHALLWEPGSDQA